MSVWLFVLCQDMPMPQIVVFAGGAPVTLASNPTYATLEGSKPKLP